MTAGGRDVGGTDTEQLGVELLKIHEDSYGATAASAHVHVLDDAVVAFLDGLELMPHEQFLVDNGRAQDVVDVRGQYQHAIEATFRAAVERATGRRVVSFASVTKLSPNYVTEIFRLGGATPEPTEEQFDA